MQRQSVSNHLETELAAISGVTQVRINPTAASIVIQYQPRLEDQIQGALTAILIAYAEGVAPFQTKPDSFGMASPLGGDLASGTGFSHEAGVSHGTGLGIGTELEKSSPAAELSQDGEDWSRLQRPLIASALALASQVPALRWLRPLAAVTLATTVLPIAQRAFLSLWRDHRLNIDCLDFLALRLSA